MLVIAHPGFNGEFTTYTLILQDQLKGKGSFLNPSSPPPHPPPFSLDCCLTCSRFVTFTNTVAGILSGITGGSSFGTSWGSPDIILEEVLVLASAAVSLMMLPPEPLFNWQDRFTVWIIGSVSGGAVLGVTLSKPANSDGLGWLPGSSRLFSFASPWDETSFGFLVGGGLVGVLPSPAPWSLGCFCKAARCLAFFSFWLRKKGVEGEK